jgi:F-type H+-transporting ATPase subunit delta
MANEAGELGVPRVYARAILDLAAAGGGEDDLLGELDDLARLIAGDGELATFFATPLVEEQARSEAIETIFRGRASDLLADALQVINRKGRLALLPAIADAYRGELRRLRGRVDARVTTAVPLSQAQRESLQAALARFSGKAADLVEKVDPGILGGLVVEVGGEKIDSSLSNQLHDAGVMLAGRAAQELHRGGSLADAAAD